MDTSIITKTIANIMILFIGSILFDKNWFIVYMTMKRYPGL
jgi:hypothetical protein